MREISIIVPTLNEQDNISPLVHRIAESFAGTDIVYEILFIDDHSKDATAERVEILESSFPLKLVMKKGMRGKAFSLLQGFKLAKYDVICMIDADLQYPPEAILPMYEMMMDNDVDLILTERSQQKTSPLRKLSTKVFNFVFTRMLFGFDYDSQSGLKLFKKKVVEKTELDPTPWSFDLEFIVRALENNFKILSYEIPFSTRFSGETKVRVAKLTYELTKASLKLRANSSSRKIKRGYRMNNRLAKQINSMALLFIFSVFGSLFLASPHNAHALSLPVVSDTLSVVNRSVLDPVAQLLSPPNPTVPSAPVAINNPAKSSTSAPSGVSQKNATPVTSATGPISGQAAKPLASNSTPKKAANTQTNSAASSDNRQLQATYPSFAALSETNGMSMFGGSKSSTDMSAIIAILFSVVAALAGLIINYRYNLI